MSDANNRARPLRRRQEDRSSETRTRIIDATIGCLYRSGYGATTIAAIAKHAEVSTGVIMYHFESKADLMVAVRAWVQADEQRLLEEGRERIGERNFLQELSRHVLAGMRRKEGIAVNEILLGARSDPVLIEKLRDMELQIERRSLERLRASYRENGLEVPDDLLTSMRVAVAAYRGLAIAELILGDEQDIEASANFLVKLFRHTADTGSRAT